MALRKRLYLSLLVVMILSLVTPLSLFAEEPVEEVIPPFPVNGTANVNGTISEWNTTTDFYGNLYVEGNATTPIRARYYLRFDCRAANPIMYVYVQAETGVSLLRSSRQWVNMDGITHVADFTGDNNVPPDWAWNTSSGSQPLYEASWPVLNWLGNHNFDIHSDVFITGVGNARLRASELGDQLILSTSNCPLAVTLNDFRATPQSDSVLVEWETASETENLGFNLYRSTSPDEVGEKLNEELIPSQAPGSGQGASYEFVDNTGQGGTTYYYRLEDVDFDGTGTMHGPVNATYPSQPTAVTLALFNTEAHDPRWAFVMGATAVGLAGTLAWRWRYRRRATSS